MDKFTVWTYAISLAVGGMYIGYKYQDPSLSLQWLSTVSLIFIAIFLIHIAKGLKSKK